MSKKERAKGADLEIRTWKDMLSKGYVCSKWHNNISLEDDKLIIARPGAFKRTSTGFPDFVCYKIGDKLTEVFGIECKCNGKLSLIEKQKCKWYLDNKIFSKILIARREKIKNRVMVFYEDFSEKYIKFKQYGS